jgi:putative oxidoreductase
MYTKIIGRILLSSLFIISALHTIFYGFDGFVKAIESKNLPFPVILAILVISIKLLGGLSIAFDRYADYGTIALLIFMLMVTPLYHNGISDPKQFNNMMKNIAIIGGFLLLL